MKEEILIRVSTTNDLDDLHEVQRSAFGSEEEADLVLSLLNDPSAAPVLSLIAHFDDQPVGHILFSNAVLDPAIEVSASILAPLAVVPPFQNQGVGSRLVKEGLRILTQQGLDWVFVLGHESYYPKFGFRPALDLGFKPPYPIPAAFKNAWMALPLTPTCITKYQGTVIPAETLEHPRYWRE
jgi:putative acetyltransferase